MGDIELFSQSLPKNRPPKIIAITGANGKTTVTSMVGAMCRAAGLITEMAGNISPAVLDVLLTRHGQHPDIWVLELSSFQLEVTSSLNADAATVLNISEDHLDRYSDIKEYAAAKARIFQDTRNNNAQRGIQVLNRDDKNSAGMALPDRVQITFGLQTPPPTEHDWGINTSGQDIWLLHGQKRVMNANELQVAGMHNVANALAALALCHAVGLPLAPLLSALRSFRGLPHRVQPIAKIGEIIFYDDSKGTNVGATIAAMQGLNRPIVLIAGGEGKGQDFTPLRAAVMQHARAVVLIGRDANKIAAVLQDCGVTIVHAKNMVDAVHQGASLALPGTLCCYPLPAQVSTCSAITVIVPKYLALPYLHYKEDSMFSLSMTNHPKMSVEYDEALVWITIALLALGLVMVYSASIATAEASRFTGFQPAYYLDTAWTLYLSWGHCGAIVFQFSL